MRLRGLSTSSVENDLDLNYKALDCQLSPLKADCDEYKVIWSAPTSKITKVTAMSLSISAFWKSKIALAICVLVGRKCMTKWNSTGFKKKKMKMFILCVYCVFDCWLSLYRVNSPEKSWSCTASALIQKINCVGVGCVNVQMRIPFSSNQLANSTRHWVICILILGVLTSQASSRVIKVQWKRSEIKGHVCTTLSTSATTFLPLLQEHVHMWQLTVDKKKN